MSIDQAKVQFARVAFAEFLGIKILDVSHERAVLLLPYQPEHANADGPLNGGASASLLNMAGAVAAWTGIDLDTEPHLNCVDMSVHYLSAAMQEDVVAEAQVLRRGRDLFFLDVALRTLEPEAKPICQGLMMYRAPDYADHEPRLRAKHSLLPEPALIPPDDPWLIDGYTQKLQMRYQHHRPGRIRLAMPCTPAHVDERGQMHEGALASIADIAGTAAAWSLIPNREGARGSTVGMQLSYPHPATEPVIADAYVQQRSEELFFSTVHVTGADTGQLVAMGQVSYRLVQPR
jgi:uncharacterized protein (TIGR00369 family)